MAAIQRAALTTLFVEREGARQLVIYLGARRDALTLGVLPGVDDASDSLALSAPDVTALRMGIPVTVLGVAELDAHFRAHADAWAGWFDTYAGSSGLVELTAVKRDEADRNAATLIVARACGEHCRSAWRVTVARDATRSWHTRATDPLRLPRS